MGRGCKTLTKLVRKPYIAVNGALSVIVIRDQKTRESLNLLRDYLSGHDQNVDRNMDSKTHSDKVSDGTEEQDIKNWGKPGMVAHTCNSSTLGG